MAVFVNGRRGLRGLSAAGFECTIFDGGTGSLTDRIDQLSRSSPYHVHTHQWEFYHVISGRGYARREGGRTPIAPGDAFLFKPGEAHAIGNEGDEDLILYVVADNPINEACYYPDSRKWAIHDRILRANAAESLDYYDGGD